MSPTITLIMALLLCPLLTGIINRVKAIVAGRNGPPLLQPYFDLAKLARKNPLYPENAGWIFRAGPTVALAAALAAAVLTPMGAWRAWMYFPGDFIFWVGAFTLSRVFMILAAVDTGSAFEGMGASREAWFGALAEPVILLALASLALTTGETNLSGFMAYSAQIWQGHFVSLIFAALALFLAALAENARIPVDDPNTHLELTMIHEVMILDHGGPDLALAHYAASLKLWVTGSLTVCCLLPVDGENPWIDLGAYLGGMLGYAVLIGGVESRMARLRMIRVSQFLAGAAAIAALSLMLAARNL